MKASLLCLSIALASCTAQQPKINTEKIGIEFLPNCDYANYQGTEIIFNVNQPLLQRYGYPEFRSTHIDSLADKPDYPTFHLKRAKVKDSIIDGWATTKWREVLTENCAKLYLRASFAGKTLSIKESQDHAYFSIYSEYTQNITNTKKLINHIGKSIWIGSGTSYQQKIVTTNNEEIYIGSNEEVTLINVTAVDSPPSLSKITNAPFYLLVKRSNSETGYYPYNRTQVHTTNPFPKSWSEKTIFAIQSRIVISGMTPEQVQMSWGKPEKVNLTTSSNNIREQWVYGNGNYLYFTNGKLVTAQTTR